MTNKLCKLIDTEAPIIQAPIHTLTNGEMIASIGEAGALGILGINAGYKVQTDATTGASVSDSSEVGQEKGYSILDTMTERNLMNEQIDSALENTFRSFAIEIASIKDQPDDDPRAMSLVKLMRKRRLTVALFESFGHPISAEWVNLLHENGIKILVKVVNKKETQEAVKAGVDALICMSDKIEEVVETAKGKPVAAGFNITSAAKVKEAISQGADGVFVNTLFNVCQEAPTNQAIKDAVIKAKTSDLVHFATPLKTFYSLPGKLPSELAEMTKNGEDKEKIFNHAHRFQGLIDGMNKADLDKGYTDLDSDLDQITASLSAEEVVATLSKGLPTNN